MIRQLRRISANIENGEENPVVTVRQLLGWYDAERRGHNVVARIRADLDELKLSTDPDFEGAWIDGEIVFGRLVEGNAEQAELRPAVQELPEELPEEVPPNAAAIDGGIDGNAEWITHDPGHQISKLAAANQGVVWVTPNNTLERARTIMIMHDFSQLPVMTNERSVQGLINWRSIGIHLSLGREGAEVRDAMIPAQIVQYDDSIFDVIAIVAQHDHVLVRDSANKISGIVTATDLSQQFRGLSEPFLLLGEIENQVRNIIGGNFPVAELLIVRDPRDARQIESVADLTFGEYVRLIENPERWARLRIAIDRAYFCERLDFVRKIRNDVMHFDPDGIQDDQLRGLRDFSRALRLLQRT